MSDPSLDAAIAAVVERALDEDRAFDDVTTNAVVPASATGTARLVARQAGVVAGLDAAVAVFARLGVAGVELRVKDGERVEAGTVVAVVSGSLRGLLAAERTALNLVQHLSGIATLTAAFVERSGGVAIRDTRKTTPGLRLLEKAAVVAGGGTNHRMSLADRVLIKDNHLAVAGGVASAVAAVRARDERLWIEVECDSLDQVAQACEAGVDEVLLDNMSAGELREAVRIVAGRCRIEASGGVALDTVAAIAATGVDAISVGALTHSAPALDIALDIALDGTEDA